MKSFSLEELSQVKVTIAGKTPQKLTDIPAAVYVLSEEDIKHSGATNIPELLRMVPGLHVARIDANKWIVSSRGFSERFTNKLLVMIDGRSVYSPLFSGVLWDQQDIILEDIERVEVIRGPGAAVWGANAVNGVINIISKQAKDVQGRMLSTTMGSEQGILSFREGSELSVDSHLKTYAKYRYQDESVDLDDEGASDELRSASVGFRSDWQAKEKSNFTLQGEFSTGETSEQIAVLSTSAPNGTEQITDQIQFTGGHLMGRWEKQYTNQTNGELKLYLEHSEREQWVIDEKRDTLDIDYKHSISSFTDHDLSLGAGYRYSRDEQKEGDFFAGQVRLYTPNKKTEKLYSAFIQDDISLVDERWWLTLGTKLEHNDYTGYEFQPNIRLRWRPAPSHMIWGAVSRAARTPSRSERNTFIVLSLIDEGPPPVALILEGSDDFDSEKLTAYELGYRFDPSPHFNVDVNLFYNEYDDLRTFEFVRAETAPPPISGSGVIYSAGNKGYGKTYGFELSTYWRTIDNQWRVRGNYSFLDIDLKARSGSSDIFIEKSGGLSPEQQLNVLTSYRLQKNLRLNIFGRYVSELATDDIDEYYDIDMGLQWQLDQDIELSIIGRNLLNDDHQEGQPSYFITTTTAVERELYLKLLWNF